MRLAIHFVRRCLLGVLPNPLLIAEVPSAAARSENAWIFYQKVEKAI